MWHLSLETAWINDMRANEYNPFHYHTSPETDLGLSSVLVLKRPETYGKEYSREDTPANGHLEFTGGNQDPLGCLLYTSPSPRNQRGSRVAAWA